MIHTSFRYRPYHGNDIYVTDNNRRYLFMYLKITKKSRILFPYSDHDITENNAQHKKTSKSITLKFGGRNIARFSNETNYFAKTQPPRSFTCASSTPSVAMVFVSMTTAAAVAVVVRMKLTCRSSFADDRSPPFRCLDDDDRDAPSPIVSSRAADARVPAPGGPSGAPDRKKQHPPPPVRFL